MGRDPAEGLDATEGVNSVKSLQPQPQDASGQQYMQDAGKDTLGGATGSSDMPGSFS